MNFRELLSGNFFIPAYQRGYSWGQEHVNDLLNDFDRAVYRNYLAKDNMVLMPEKTRAHYLASIILMNRQDSDSAFDIIDGQQRITTTLIILGVIRSKVIDIISNNGFDYDYSHIVEDINSLLWPARLRKRFILQSVAEEKNRSITYLNDLLLGKGDLGKEGKQVSGSQKNIKARYEDIVSFFDLKLKDLDVSEKLSYFDRFYDCIANAELTKHVVGNIIEANRIFITLNARGKPLSNFDKIKGLLIYFSERIANQTLALRIDKTFGLISDTFELVDDAIHIGKYQFNSDASKFTEDSLISWHYCVFERGNQIKSSQDVYLRLESYLNERYDKAGAGVGVNDLGLEVSAASESIRESLESYIESLESFCGSISKIIEKASSDTRYFEVVAMCGLTNIVWPFVIACESKGESILSSEVMVSKAKKVSMIEAIMIVDKIHRLSRAQGRPIVELAYDVFSSSDKLEAILFNIQDVLNRYHDKQWGYTTGYSVKDRLLDEGGIRYSSYIFLRYCLSQSGKSYSISELKSIKEKNYTAIPFLRHYLGVDVKKHGFERGEKDFVTATKKIGNLILVEKRIASALKGREEEEGDLPPNEVKKEILGFKKAKHLQDTLDSLSIISEASAGKFELNQSYIKDRTKSIESFLDAEFDKFWIF